jgi:hypothetical protein
LRSGLQDSPTIRPIAWTPGTAAGLQGSMRLQFLCIRLPLDRLHKQGRVRGAIIPPPDRMVNKASCCCCCASGAAGADRGAGRKSVRQGSTSKAGTILVSCLVVFAGQLRAGWNKTSPALSQYISCRCSAAAGDETAVRPRAARRTSKSGDIEVAAGAATTQ